MASYLSATGVTLRNWRTRLIAGGIFLLPVLIILLEKDTGSALVFFSFLLVLYREGLPAQWYVLGLGIGGAGHPGTGLQPTLCDRRHDPAGRRLADHSDA